VRRIAIGAAGLVVAVVLQTGCGSSASSTNADPATITPVSAPLYVSVAIKPSGGPRGDAVTDLERLTHLTDPNGRLAEALLETQSSHPGFKREIEPWIGARAAIFLTALPASGLVGSRASPPALLQSLGPAGVPGSLGARAFGSRGVQGAIVLDTSVLSRARAFLDGRAREQQAHAVSYRGIRFQVSSSGGAQGIVHGFAVIGSESGMKGVIDTSLGGTPLSRAAGYAKPPSNAIASAYLAPQRLASAMRSSPNAAPQAIPLLEWLFAGAQSTTLFVTPGASSLSLEGQLHAASVSEPPFGEGGAQALRSLPGGSWLAAGVGDLSASLPRWLALLRGAASPGASSMLTSLGAGGIERLFAQLSSSSARLRQDFARWAGPAGVFVSGSGLLDLQAALVIDSRDPVASRAAVGELANVMRKAGAAVARTSIAGTDAAVSVRLSGFPAVLYIADGQSKLVVGLGGASIVGALHPTSTLASSPSYATAALALGDGVQPSVIVEFPALLGLLEAIGLTQSPPISSAVPYLKSLGTLTAGSVGRDGAMTTTARFRAVLGLADAAQSG
jgi:hypothetical protein